MTIACLAGTKSTLNDNLRQVAEPFLQILGKNPYDPVGYHNLGTALIKVGLLAEAETCLRRAIALNPQYSEAYCNLGSVLNDIDKLAEAETCLRRAIILNPYYTTAYNYLGRVLNNARRFDEAIACFRQAIALNPDYSEAYNNLGSVLHDTNHLEEAQVCFLHAVELAPFNPDAYNNLGIVQAALHLLDEAEVCFRRVLALNPNNPIAYHNLGIVLQDAKRLDEAEACLLKAIELKGDYPEAECALGLLYLLQGRYNEGWKRYVCRYKLYGYAPQEIPQWQGEALTGQKILLFQEQGFGDTIQAFRFAKKVSALASQTTLWVKEPLARLLSSFQSQVIIHCGDSITGHFDFTSTLLNLPYIFNTSEATIPLDIPYIWPSKEVSAKWRTILDQIDQGQLYRIGVVWAGNSGHANDRNRSIPFDLFSKLFDIANVNWVNLQVGIHAQDLSRTPHKVVDFSPQLVDFSETAGVIDHLDLVITVDTAMAHLAGAMGKNTWLLLPFAPDWRWQLDRVESPWYPTMRLFRQTKCDDWEEVLTRVIKTLRQQVFT